MRVTCCSVCHSRYDEEERAPLLLHCGHGFCKACLSKMFTASADTSLCCPRCRHPTLVGNSIHALRKNFPIFSLLTASPLTPSLDYDFTDDDENSGEDEDIDDGYFPPSGARGRVAMSSHSGCCSPQAPARPPPPPSTSATTMNSSWLGGSGKGGDRGRRFSLPFCHEVPLLLRVKMVGVAGIRRR